ncbi:hypothetical protein [Streptomyces sp. NPDC001985]
MKNRQHDDRTGGYGDLQPDDTEAGTAAPEGTAAKQVKQNNMIT